MPIKGGIEARKKRKEKREREKKQRYALSKRERVCNTTGMKEFPINGDAKYSSGCSQEHPDLKKKFKNYI